MDAAEQGAGWVPNTGQGGCSRSQQAADLHAWGGCHLLWLAHKHPSVLCHVPKLTSPARPAPGKVGQCHQPCLADGETEAGRGREWGGGTWAELGF